MLEQWELANFKPEYQFVVRQYAIGKGHSVSVMWRGGEVDTIFGFEKEADALQWIVERLGGDRGQTRSEIDKLLLYKGSDTAKTITLAGTDPNGDTLTFRVTSRPTNGSLYDGTGTGGHLIVAGDLPYLWRREPARA